MGNILESAFFDNQGTIGGPSNPNTGEGLAAQRSNQIVLRDLAGSLPIQSVSILDGTITPPNGAYLEIDTEGQAPADDLSVINSIRSESDTIHDGMILHVRAKEESRVVTLKNSSGINGIQTVGGSDIVLNTTDWVKLMRTSGSWHEVREKTIGDASYTQKGIVQFASNEQLEKPDHTEAELIALEDQVANARQFVELAGKGGLGVPLGFSCIWTEPYIPEGAILYNGELVTNFRSAYPDFYNEFIKTGKVHAKPMSEFVSVTAPYWQEFFYDDTTGDVRVPKPAPYIGATAVDTASLGEYVEAGLPNIAGTLPLYHDNTNLYSGAFYQVIGSTKGAGSNEEFSPTTKFDASLSNTTYGKSDTVTPEHMRGRWIGFVYNGSSEVSEAQVQEFVNLLAGKASKEEVGQYSVIYGLGQKAIYDPDNQYAIEDEALGVNGTVSSNQLYILENPFGINTPIQCVTELLVNDEWVQLLHTYSDTSLIDGFGAGGNDGVGIVLRTRNRLILSETTNITTYSKAGMPTVTSSQCRIKVWKIGV